MKCYIKFALIFFLLANTAKGQDRTESLNSPDGKIFLTFKLSSKGLEYTFKFKGTSLVNSSLLRLEFDNGSLENLRLNSVKVLDTTENYDLFAGKTKHVSSHYKQIILPLEETSSPFRKINIIARVFNDGLAFRYEYPMQENWKRYTLLDEHTEINISGNPIVNSLFFPNYTNSHEGIYQHVLFSKLVRDTLLDLPSLIEYPDHLFMAITEAAVLDYAGMYLSKEGAGLVSKLSPLPNQHGIKVKAILPHKSPWRVFLIGDKIGSLMESNIITSLNDPSKIKDVSWLKPGKTTFPWWNGNVVPDSLNAPGNNFVTAKYYIDFCARNHIEYHSLVEYGLHQWYVDDGVSFQPGPHSNVTQPVPGLDMKEICDYAKSKGVGIRVWVHWAALYPRLDSAFAIFEKWGLQGMMVDFMDRDDQEMVNIQTEILEKAALHHLHIQFHGAYKPTGINRTYPNEFTREGTRNYEVDKWDAKGISPDHDITMPFTRGLAGSTDYHLGGFRAVTNKKFKTQYTRPLVLGTRTHMLAMYVVLENYLQMVCDYPAAYEGQPGFSFIKEVPTTWDEIKVLDAIVNEYIVIARRKRDDWYIGAITNTTGRKINISFSFLNTGNYKAEIISDANDTDQQPDHLVRKFKNISKKDQLGFNLNSGGGLVMHLKRI